MTLMQWEDRYELGVPEMDQEHRTLVSLMNQLFETVQAADREAQAATLAKLGDFTTKHFQDEERYMESVGFPGLQRHKGHHERLLQKLGEHAKRFAEGEELDEKFFGFLRFWLASHICGIDTKYRDHARARSA